MRVVLTKPWLPPAQRTIVTLPIGSLYVASFLRRSCPDVDVAILDPDVTTLDEQRFVESIVSPPPDVVGVTIFSHVVPVARRMVERLHALSPSTVIVVGGPHVNAVREKIFSQIPSANFGFWGEGEKGFAALCRDIANGVRPTHASIPGLIARTADEKVAVAQNAYSDDLEDFEPIDYTLVHTPSYFQGSPMGLFHRGRNVAQIVTTRGCPFLCTFCASPLNMGRKVRARPMRRIMNDLLTLHSFGADEIHLMDDNFTFNKQHVLEFCSGVRDLGFKLHFALPNGVRLDKLDDEMLEAMRAAGFYHLGFGIEVGSDESLRRIRKSLTMAIIKEKVAMAKRHGMGTTGFFIVGFPFEQEADMRQTASTPDRLGLDLASFGNFTPLPGTQLFDELVKSGEIPPDYLPSFASGKATYAPSSVGLHRLESIHRSIVLRYYIHPKRITLLLRVLQWKDLKYVLRRLLHIVIRPSPAS